MIGIGRWVKLNNSAFRRAWDCHLIVVRIKKEAAPETIKKRSYKYIIRTITLYQCSSASIL
jgi:hypothetical protein